MSADIYLNPQPCPTCGRGGASEGQDFNITYNLSPMLYAAGMAHWESFKGLTGAVAGERWAGVLTTLKADPERFKAMNPTNGWGSYDAAVHTLSSMVSFCNQNPDLTVDLSL